jgi:hypothetical protein
MSSTCQPFVSEADRGHRLLDSVQEMAQPDHAAVQRTMPQETTDVPGNLLPCDGKMYFFPDAIAPDEAAHLYARLRREIAFVRPIATVYGRQHTLPRGQAWFSCESAWNKDPV